MIEFTYFRCPECDFDIVLAGDRLSDRDECPLCAGDSGRHVIMRTREARPDDRPEGRDSRAVKPDEEAR